MVLTQRAKLAATVTLFGVAIVLLGVAALAGLVGPLFGAWVPLLGVAWVLTRPEHPHSDPEREPVEGDAAMEGDARTTGERTGSEDRGDAAGAEPPEGSRDTEDPR